MGCKRCKGEKVVKNGKKRGKQRYLCKECGYTYIEGDERTRGKWDNKTKALAVRMYLNNCGFRRISEILQVPLSTVFIWIKEAGKIVEEIVKERKESYEKIEVLEMDELFTYIKKSQEKIKKQKNSATHTQEYGLLLIGTDLKLFRLK